CARGVISDFW
nr:immunoglobulin heavy chain junction region [Macaca mulatta]